MIGTAALNNASVSVLLGNERWTVANLKAALRFTANQAQIDSLNGTIGGGRISATGGALLEGFTVSAFRINVRGDDVTVPFPPDFRSTLDADVEIRGSSREQLIGGVVTCAAPNTPRTSNWLTSSTRDVASRSKKAPKST